MYTYSYISPKALADIETWGVKANSRRLGGFFIESDMKYIYLRESPSGLITSDKRTTLQVTWKDKVDGCIFYPNSTWAQCRNLLLEEALKVGNE